MEDVAVSDEPKTVKVRIAVAVDDVGRWRGYGDWDIRDDEAMGEAMMGAGDDHVRYWLTADLPLPATPTVEAAVEPADPGDPAAHGGGRAGP